MTIPSDMIGGPPCLDFANGVARLRRVAPERRYRFLVSWGRQAQWISGGDGKRLMRVASQQPSRAESVVRRATRLAEALRTIFRDAAEGKPPPSVPLGVFDRELAAAFRHARLRPGASAYAWEWGTDTVAPDQILWPVVRSAADLLVSDGLSRVKVCASASCRWLFLDSSKNGRRRWCDMKSCGNREKALRYRRRRRAAASDRARSGRSDAPPG
jgi:predicted RNA-binding Zn ribbon-like protein